MTPRSLRRLALAAVTAATVAACGGASTGTDAVSGSSAERPTTDAGQSGAGPTGTGTSPDRAVATEVPGSESATETTDRAAGNAEALAFTGVDLDGEPVDAQAYAGGDVVLWMWAPW